MESQPLEVARVSRSTDTDGNLLFFLIALLYGGFSFLLNSSTAMITWPWVALWQALMILPMVWLLWQLWAKPWSQFRLGNGFDWLVLVGVGVLGLSTLAAEFPYQARWYAWAALGGLAALYGLMGWLTPQRSLNLLRVQGWMGLVFILLSLGLWLVNTYLPERDRLATLRQFDIVQSFNLGSLGLRNWFLIGHQNYVAGYVLLLLPLFVALAWKDTARRRGIWLAALPLGLLDLYTTGSRGGVLGLAALLVPILGAIVLSGRLSLARVLPLGLVAITGLGAIAWFNPRVQNTLTNLLQGNITPGYRVITNAVGWHMGLARPWAGLGLGSVPLVYQRYRPVWAGREAEWHHQLHSTPAQLWAELGLGGVVLPLVALGMLAIALWRYGRSPHLPAPLSPGLLGSLAAAIWGYGVMSLTDYQLDVIPIAGVLLVYGSVLLYGLRSAQVASQGEAPSAAIAPPRFRRFTVGLALGIIGAITLWLIPIHRAWSASAIGFLQLERKNYPAFVANLELAHQRAPWQSYYPWMLGWGLGDLSYQTADPDLAQQMRQDAIAWFQKGNAVSPYQEFGYSNLAWLQTQTDAPSAIASFVQAARLLPAKAGVFWGLGYNLFRVQKRALATDAIALELVRHPLAITSPQLQTGIFQNVAPEIVERTEALLGSLLAEATEPSLLSFLHQVRGALRWWNNNLAGAAEDWAISGSAISRTLLAIAQGETPDLDALPELPGKYALQAWYQPENRPNLLLKAWMTKPEDLPLQTGLPDPALITELANTMDTADTFDQWLKEKAPNFESQSRRLGFGVFSRQDDGPNPDDFYFRVENLAMQRFFEDVVPPAIVLPALDIALQPYREKVFQGSQTEG